MKRFIMLCVTMLAAAVCVTFMGSSSGTGDRWKVVRALSATDDTGPTATTSMYVVGEWVEVNSTYTSLGGVIVQFVGTGNENTTGTYCVEFSKGLGSPAEYCCHGTFTLGATIRGSTRYADVITLNNHEWYKEPWVKTGYLYNMGTGAVAGAGVGGLIVDSCEYNYIRVNMAKGTCTTVGAYLHNFN